MVKRSSTKICYDAFQIINEKTGRDAMEVFEEAMNNIMPLLEVKARRIGGANYQVPIEVRPERRQTLGLRWLLAASRKKRGEKYMRERLAGELMDAANNTGAAVKKREDTLTKWLKLIKHLLITDINKMKLFWLKAKTVLLNLKTLYVERRSHNG